MRAAGDHRAGRGPALLDDFSAAPVDRRTDRATVIILEAAIDRRICRGGADLDTLHATVDRRAACRADVILEAAVDDRAGGRRAGYDDLRAAVNRRVARRTKILLGAAGDRRAGRETTRLYDLVAAVDDRAGGRRAGFDDFRAAAVDRRADCTAEIILEAAADDRAARRGASHDGLVPAMDCRTARDGTGFHELQTAIDRRIGRAAASKYVLRPGVDDGAGRNAACLDELEAAGIDDRADRRPKILLSTAIDRRGDHGAAGEDDLDAAVHRRIARGAAVVHILRAAVVDGAGCNGTRLDELDAAAIDDRADRRPEIVLSTAIDRCGDRRAAGEDELGAAIHHRVARDAAGFDILVTGIDCRAGRGARVVLNAAVNGRVDRGAAERD